MPEVTLERVEASRVLFAEREWRSLFYKVAAYLVEASFEGGTPFTLAEALAVLLRTWNREFYRFRGATGNDLEPLAKLLDGHMQALIRLRDQKLPNITESEGAEIRDLFTAFEAVLGPVGTAKALHLLAPGVFPLWDRAITKAYGIYLGPSGANGELYWRFVGMVREQIERAGLADHYRDPLKALDEYNYCALTKGWM